MGGVIQAAHVSGFRINFSKKFTPMMVTAQSMGGEGATDCGLCCYLPASRVGGRMKDLAYVRVLRELEGKVS